MIRRIACIAALASILPTVAMGQEAQNESRFRIGLNVGATVPAGAWADLGGVGYHTGVAATVRSPGFPIAARVDLSYHNLTGRDSLEGTGRLRTHPAALSGIVHALWRAGGPEALIRPFVLAGSGLNEMRLAMECRGDGTCGGQRSSSVSRPVFGGGGGVQVERGTVTLQAEVRWYTVPRGVLVGPPTNRVERAAHLVPITVGVLFR